MSAGYYRFPTVNKDTVIFVCEDDLWSVPLHGGVAHRLTANLSEVSRPSISPDGRWVAFTGRDEGNSEVYVMPARGGAARRVTFQGGVLGGLVVGWSEDSQHIIYASDYGQPFVRMLHLWKVSAQGGNPEKLPFGPARNVSFGPRGKVVIGRNTSDPARWKRYRGGTAGDIWIDTQGKGKFKRLLKVAGNLGDPMWIDNRIYFLSDHEGIGNIYSCTTKGEDLKRHTHHDEYYVRHPQTDGEHIIYHAGADLYCWHVKSEKVEKIEVEFNSPQVQRNRKFVSADRNLNDYALHPEGHSVVLTTRGRPFSMALWEGAVTQYGQLDGVRYRLTRWSSDGKSLITVSDADGEEAIEVHPIDKKSTPKRFDKLDIGRPLNFHVSPHKKRAQIAFSNHRNEVHMVDLKNGKHKIIDRSIYRRIIGLAWSPDGEWLAYGCFTTQNTCCIKLANINTGETFELTRPDFVDGEPCFDSEGKYLYFVSERVFNPVYDNMYFDLGFPNGSRLYLITLTKDLKSPFIPEPKAPGRHPAKEDFEELMEEKEKKKKKKGKDDEKEEEIKPIQIDLDGIQDRVIPFPIPEGRYGSIRAIKDKVMFTAFPVTPSFPDDFKEDNGKEPEGMLMMYDFEEKKLSTIVRGVQSFKLSRHSKTLIYRNSENQLRVWKSGERIESKGMEFTREAGWLDLSRIRISVIPPLEWKQMYREAWRLQRDQYWVPDMAGIDWERIYHRYLPLIDRLCTRSEVSDLMWEMQGELGTSHCYEFGGDYRPSPRYNLGFLGADLAFDPQTKQWRIAHLVKGDSWVPEWDSPLNAPGLNINVGDVILEVGGYPVDEDISPMERLVHLAGQEVTLTLAADKDAGYRPVTIKTLKSELSARYREWVENNRRMVHEATNGQVGYVHVPNMGPWGYAEFHRYYLPELQYQGLIVDVRFNGGGHVSQLILEKLARKRIGYDLQRWGQPESYPSHAVLGPIVALTNEHAGSDGDIFSHSFKLMKLGTLIGKRTWGGVIGIWPRHALVDGTVTTQPEFSFWFKDVGWQVENYGTDPDIEVDIAPQDYVAGQDPQMDKGIKVILKQLKENPPFVPDFGNRPNLALPTLPKG